MSILQGAERPLPESIQKDVELLIDHIDRLLEILLAGVDQKPAFSAAPIVAAIARDLSLTFTDGNKIFQALDNLYEFRIQLHDTQQVLTHLANRLSEPRAKKLEMSAEKFSQVMNVYSDNHPFLLSSKAEKLTYLHENLYQDAEIITDARPVFTADGGYIVEMVITHSLVLSSYRRGVRSERSHFAMDAADVLRLRDLCDRAIKKANVLKDALGGNKWTVKVLNEGDDATR